MKQLAEAVTEVLEPRVHERVSGWRSSIVAPDARLRAVTIQSLLRTSSERVEPVAAERDVVEFSELYRAHASDVHRFALFLSGHPALADDIVSETFIRLWHARRRVDLTTVKGYLLAIARNLFLAERRHVRRMTTLDDRARDDGPGPERRTHSQIELHVVLAALQTLPEIDRSAVLLRAEE